MTRHCFGRMIPLKEYVVINLLDEEFHESLHDYWSCICQWKCKKNYYHNSQRVFSNRMHTHHQHKSAAELAKTASCIFTQTWGFSHFSRNYQPDLFRRGFTSISVQSISEAVKFIHITWQNVISETITNCFRYGVFLPKDFNYDVWITSCSVGGK